MKKPIKELLQFSIINIDKPANPTSFGVDTIIKKELELTKTSHFGTLDPIVTGVLPVALNRACRLMSYFIGKKKTYVGVMHLHEDIEEEKLKQEMKKFTGEITQLPPVKSRVKRQERQRTIHTFKLLEKKGQDVLFEAEVEAGTYIRKLCHDLGEKIGGAHMTELRRTQASIFYENDSHTIFEFLEAVEKYKQGDEKPLRQMLTPGEQVIKKVMPEIQIKKQYIEKLWHGSPLFKKYVDEKANLDLDKNYFAKQKGGTSRQRIWVGITKSKEDEKIAIFHKDKFIGVFKTIKDKQILAKPEFVLQPIK